MAYLYGFLFCGFVCALAQVIYECTKLTPGHITSIFVLLGIFLEAFGIYSVLIKNLPGGAGMPILNFGYLLADAVKEGVKSDGFIGIFKNMLKPVSASLTVVVTAGVIAGAVGKLKA